MPHDSHAGLASLFDLRVRPWAAWSSIAVAVVLLGAYGIVDHVRQTSPPEEMIAATIASSTSRGHQSNSSFVSRPLFQAASAKGQAANTDPPEPVSVSLKLAQDTYELDERLDGVGNIVNPNPVPVSATVRIDLLKGRTSIKTVTLDFPCSKDDKTPSCVPVGKTPLKPADALYAVSGFDRIPPDPAHVGSWTLAVTMTSPSANAALRRIVLPFQVVPQEAAAVSIDGYRGMGTIGPLHGFVIPPKPSSDTTKQLMAALKPQVWRVWFEHEFSDVVAYNPKKFTLSTEGDYYWQACRDRRIPERCDAPNPALFLPTILPWENDYAYYKAYIAARARNALRVKTQNKNAPEIYLGWWNEPENPGMGQNFGTNEQMFATFKVFHDTVRSVNPGQKIEAPTMMGFNELFLREFLEYVAEHNLRLDAVSWHEWTPDHIRENVETVRNWFARNPDYCRPKCPEIHINEFNGAPHYFIPGWQGAYLINLENSGIDAASGNGCFIIGLPGGRKTDTCYDNYMGLFVEQDGRHNEVPQPNYWVHWAYAEMHGAAKLSVTSSSDRVVAMAGKSDADKTVRLLVSRYSCGKSGAWCESQTFFDSNEQKAPVLPVTITVSAYPYASRGGLVRAEIYRIPNENVPGPFTEADLAHNKAVQTLSVNEEGNVVIRTPNYQDGDAYYIILTPMPPETPQEKTTVNPQTPNESYQSKPQEGSADSTNR